MGRSPAIVTAMTASPAPQSPPASSAKSPDQPAPNQIKETLISIIIAFVLAFVFRQFVIEAFIIPTGSMAPTLMGEHIRMTSPNTGYEWPVGPQYNLPTPGGGGQPLSIQGDARSGPVRTHDPMTGPPGSGQMLERSNLRLRSGDRIIVFKYLYDIYDPKRFDVVVFKAPHDPKTNYIKRLVGLPGEELALVDGDVFARKPEPAGKVGEDGWAMPGWTIQRKPERAQRAMWQDVFSSEYQPLDPNARNRNGLPFKSPWLGGDGWQIDGRRSYEYTRSGPTTLSWNSAEWPIGDFYPYNERPNTPSRPPNIFPVADLMLSCGLEPLEGSVNVAAEIRARGHDFRVEVRGAAVTLKMGPVGPDRGDGRRGPATDWTTLGTGTLPHELRKGRVTNVEVWHVDQTLQLWVEGKRIAIGEYNWTPVQRTAFATGLTTDHITRVFREHRENPLANPASYAAGSPEFRWEFDGPVRLHRVGVKRDVHYQPGGEMSIALRACHPTTVMHLGPDHFFTCGDNSPNSLDARAWGDPDPWVAKEIDNTPGIVPRKLMIGKAFFVYFPSIIRGESSGLPVPDFGRLRWIF